MFTSWVNTRIVRNSLEAKISIFFLFSNSDIGLLFPISRDLISTNKYIQILEIYFRNWFFLSGIDIRGKGIAKVENPSLKLRGRNDRK